MAVRAMVLRVHVKDCLDVVVAGWQIPEACQGIAARAGVDDRRLAGLSESTSTAKNGTRATKSRDDW
jgi:hypothetical protein